MYFTQLTSGADIVILPIAAEFNNITGNLQTVKIQRSMVGDIYSTVKRTSNVVLKLQYKLDRISIKQLQHFMLTHPFDLITLDDWAGRRYIGYLYNETFDSTEDQLWSNSIELLFEGQRLI